MNHHHHIAAAMLAVYIAAGAGLLALIVYRVLDALGPLFGG